MREEKMNYNGRGSASTSCCVVLQSCKCHHLCLLLSRTGRAVGSWLHLFLLWPPVIILLLTPCQFFWPSAIIVFSYLEINTRLQFLKLTPFQGILCGLGVQATFDNITLTNRPQRVLEDLSTQSNDHRERLLSLPPSHPWGSPPVERGS